MKLACTVFLVMMAAVALAQVSPKPQQGAAPAQASPQAAPSPEPNSGHSAETPAKPAQVQPKSIPEDAAVITINGLCASSAVARPPAAKTGGAGSKSAAASAAQPCKTVVTRAQFERVLNTVRPNLPPPARRRIAEEYVTFMTMTEAATKSGVEKDPDVQEKLRLARMQVLASAYTQKLQQKAAEVPPADIEKYYNDNKAQYDSVDLKRIYIPKPAPGEKSFDEQAAKALADRIRESAVKGEDFDKLQKQAFESSGNKGTAPNTDIGEKRHGMLPPKQEADIFKLKEGEVSPLFEEPSGFFVYKVTKKGAAPLEQVKPEILRTLEAERMRGSIDELKSTVKPVFNDAYFGPPPPSSATLPSAPAPSRPGPGAAPSAATPPPPPSGAAAAPASENPPK